MQRKQEAHAVCLYLDIDQASACLIGLRFLPLLLSLISHLAPPFALVVKLLYGCGLRLFECLNLRIQCLNFDAGKITIHEGKGKKDRTVPLPMVQGS